MGACQDYLNRKKTPLIGKKEDLIDGDQELTKAKYRTPLRGRTSDMSKWKIRTPEMTEDEYQAAIREYRRLYAIEWRKKNPKYHTNYQKKYRDGR